MHERFRQATDRRQTDGRWHIANVNVSSRSLKTAKPVLLLTSLLTVLKPIENSNCLTQSTSGSVRFTFQLTVSGRFRSSRGQLNIERLLSLVSFVHVLFSLTLVPIFVVFGLHDFSSWTAQNWLDYTLTSRPVVRLEVHGVSPKGRRRSMMGRVCETDRFYAENEKK